MSSIFKAIYNQNPSTFTNHQIQFNSNYKTKIYQILINPNKLQYPIYTNNNILFFNPLDKEFITKTLTKNIINFKILLT